MDYDLMISELYQTQHDCYMLAMALNNVVELVPVYEHTLQPSGAGEALLIQQITDALVRADITPSYEGLLESAWNLVVKFIRKLGEYLKKVCDWISAHIQRWFSKEKSDKLSEHLAYIEKHRDIYNKWMNRSEFGQEVLNIQGLIQLQLAITPSQDPTSQEPQHPTFNSLSGRLECINNVLDRVEHNVIPVLDRVRTYAVVDVVDIFQHVYNCDVQKKERTFQNIIDALVTSLTNLQTPIASLNKHCLEYTSIGSGWDTVADVRKTIEYYHTAAGYLNQLDSSLESAAVSLSSKSFDNIRIDMHSRSLTSQQSQAFRAFVSDYSNACHTMMYTVTRIHEMLMNISGDMTRVFHTVELARTRLETGIAKAHKNGNTRNGTPVVVTPRH